MLSFLLDSFDTPPGSPLGHREPAAPPQVFVRDFGLSPNFPSNRTGHEGLLSPTVNLQLAISMPDSCISYHYSLPLLAMQGSPHISTRHTRHWSCTTTALAAGPGKAGWLSDHFFLQQHPGC